MFRKKLRLAFQESPVECFFVSFGGDGSFAWTTGAQALLPPSNLFEEVDVCGESTLLEVSSGASRTGFASDIVVVLLLSLSNTT